MQSPTSIRPFIGSKNFEESCSFYRQLGFEEIPLENNLHLFKMGSVGFYLQRAYVKDWVDNSMVFVELPDLDRFYKELMEKELVVCFPGARISAIQTQPWGRVIYVHDPSGILWHFGSFS